MISTNKVTIEDIAKKANVSIATVSRIINNKGSVKKETHQRVLEVMEELNFHPYTNKNLASTKSSTILMCVPEIRNPFFSTVIDGVQKSAYRHNYHVLLLQAKDLYTEFEDFAAILRSQSIAGVILLSHVTSAKLAADLNFCCPVVMCSEYCEEADMSFVSIDDDAAAQRVTEYLISTGCKRIALINSSLKNRYARHREKGYRRAMEKAGLTVNESWIVHLSSVSYDLALSNALHILSLPERPEAFFTVSDVYAIGVIKAAQKRGLRVPDDISVVGFDNLDLSAMITPALTTIEQPSYQIGYQSCELLIEKIEKPQSESKKIILDTELIVRDSTTLKI